MRVASRKMVKNHLQLFLRKNKTTVDDKIKIKKTGKHPASMKEVYVDGLSYKGQNRRTRMGDRRAVKTEGTETLGGF